MRQLDCTKLAADFCRLVRAELTPAELADVQANNLLPEYADCDALHDYLDANDIMAEALALQGATLADHTEEVNRTWQRCREARYQVRTVLVSCEFSGIVRNAVSQYGHYAVSADILPTESPGRHYTGDVRRILGNGWSDILSFPPCTYLCGSGAKHRVNNPERWAKSRDALQFVQDHMDAPCDRSMLENSVGLISTEIRKPDQIIQPYEFGNDASKRTCLWLKNLQKLVTDPADYVTPRLVEYKGKLVKRWANQSPCGADKTAPGPDRWKIRSRTYPGIAIKGFAAQWFNPATI